MSFSNHSFSRSFFSSSEGIYQNLYVSGVFVVVVVVVFRAANVDLIQMVGKKHMLVQSQSTNARGKQKKRLRKGLHLKPYSEDRIGTRKILLLERVWILRVLWFRVPFF